MLIPPRLVSSFIMRLELYDINAIMPIDNNALHMFNPVLIFLNYPMTNNLDKFRFFDYT
jgi:hypothetical protein